MMRIMTRGTARSVGDKWRRSSTLEDIAAAQAESGDIRGALVIARGIAHPEIRSEAFRDITDAQARVGDIGEALAAARRIRGPYDRAMALHDIARTLVKATYQSMSAR